MQVAYSLQEVNVERPSVVTVGMFDGVHLGHQSLIQQAVQMAREKDGAAVVVSFFPHPDKVLRQITGRYYLTPPEEKARILRLMGVDALVLHPFNESVRQMRAADFADQLREHLRLVDLWAAPDFAMGYQREGTIAFLTAQGAQKGFSVHTVDLLSSSNQKIGSSTIREFLQAGQVGQAAVLLGRPYRLAGEVIDGDKRGHKIGFPTANIAVWEEQIIPAHGVYACRAYLDQEEIQAVTNIGKRPTFAGQDVTVEAHLMNFDRQIYGQTLALEFIEHLRGEQKFDGIEALVAQIGADRDRALAILQAE